MSKWARVRVNLKKKKRKWKRKKKMLSSGVLRLRFCVQKVSSKHLWFQSPFLFILLSFPTLLLYLFSLLPWLDHFSLQFYLHNHQTCFFFFFQTFLSLNFIPRGKYDYSALRSFTFEVLQFESIPLSGRSHIWLFQSPTVKLSHHLQ